MIGVGTDIVEIERFNDLCDSEAFLKKYFTLNENEYFNKKGQKSQTLAGVFCVKEAVAKALGTGISGFGLIDIEVLHDDLGKPYVKLHNNALIRFDNLGAKAIHVSISHSNNNAVAFAVIE